MLVRFVIYGLLGVCAEVAVSAILHKYEGKDGISFRSGSDSGCCSNICTTG